VTPAPRRDDPVVVVGAGVAGLACALELASAGTAVQVIEASDRPGGRVRTDVVDGFRLDRGFQVLLTAYPEARRLLDLAALDLRAFEPGALVRMRGRFEPLPDPLRRPWRAPAALWSRAMNASDKLGVLALRRRLAGRDVEALLAGDSRPTREALRDEGFSSWASERFFRPFLGGVFLERELATSSRAFRFVFRMFAEGDAALPAEGMEAIPRQLAARLPEGALRTGTAVRHVEPWRVTLADGSVLRTRAVVVATDPASAARLLPGLEVPPMNPATCLWLDAPASRPLAALGRTLVLDGDGAGPVTHLCVASAVAPGYAPPGRALVSASVVGAADPDDEALAAAARRQLEGWLGPGVDAWRLLRVDRIPEALPRQEPGPFEPAPRPARRGWGLAVCGDHRDVASLQGALASGCRAAAAILDDLRASS